MLRTRRLDKTRSLVVSRELPKDPKRHDELIDHVYLTLGNNEPSEMFVTYHQNPILKRREVYYRKKGESSWDVVYPRITRFQNEPINIYHSKLINLKGDTE